MRTQWLKVNLLLVPLVSLGLIGATAATASASTTVAPKAATYQVVEQSTHELGSRATGLTLTAAQLAELRAALVRARASAHVDKTHHACVRIYRWELEDIAWAMIFGSTGVEIAGIILDATGVAAPLGVILNVLGLAGGVSGAYLLWWADNRFPASRTICLTWT